MYPPSVLARVRSAAVIGLQAHPVDVEVDVGRGLPSFAIVGLPDPAVQEAKERVRAAVRNAGYELPPRRITVNLAPADVRKAGPGFDLPMAVGVLAPWAFASAGGSEPSSMTLEVPVEAGDRLCVSGILRGLQLRRRSVQRWDGAAFHDTDALQVEDQLLLAWDEAIEREFAFPMPGSGMLRLCFECQPEASEELVRAPGGELQGRVLRRTEALREPLEVGPRGRQVARPGDVARHEHEVLGRHARVPGRGHALRVPDPLRTEAVHLLARRAEREMRIREGEDTHRIRPLRWADEPAGL